MRNSLHLILVLVVLSALSACDGATDTPTPPPAWTPTPAPASTSDQEVLTVLYWQAPSVPNPYLSRGNKDTDAGAVTLEPLAVYDPDGNIVPDLAAAVPTLENGGVAQDLMSITWTLKEGLLWSDGAPLTADDVVFTWRYCSDHRTGCTASDAFQGVASVEALGAVTVRITFEDPTPYPYNAFVGMGTPVISAAQFADCIGAAATTCDAQNYAPLGTGPYRIVGFEPNAEAVYERNPFYRGPEAYFDRVVIEGGGDALSAARAVLESGEADYAWNLQIDPEVLSGMEAMGRGKVVAAFSSLVERIVVNQTNADPALGEDRSEYLDGENPHPFLTFPPVLQAMSMAIDRNLIADRLYGFAGEATCNIVAGPPAYASTTNDACVMQDIDGANLLLDDNGVLDTDGDGIREHNGVPLRIVYQTSTNAIRQETQALIRDWWREIGIETEIAHYDAALFFGGDPVENPEESYRRFFADVQMYASGSGIDPQQYLLSQLCDHIQARGNNWADGNNARSCNPAYDELYAEFAGLGIGPERTELIKRLNDLHVQSHFEIPLVNRGFVSAHLNTLKGVRINGWDSELWNIGEWHR
ncbi:MAG: peptide ABC transporter substrate-binding protein [Chloroflexi bacterium]|nr:peptide ABC transporter substrate-binding protein [Chloroflexota bacterium]